MNGLPQTLPLTISEAVFQRTVLDTAKVFGWHRAHFRPAPRQSGGFSTPMSGEVGFPDLVLARSGELIVAELKRHGQKPTPAQQAWLLALGGCGRRTSGRRSCRNCVMVRFGGGPHDFG